MSNAKDFKGYDGVFAKRLRHIMDATRTTQETLAKQIGLTRQTISQYMDGSVLPNAEKLHKMCVYFNIPSDYLLGHTDSQSTDITEQLIQDKTGLSKKSIATFVGAKHGYKGELFGIPYNSEALDYILSNEDFVQAFLNQLLTCWYEKSEEEKDNKRVGRPIISEDSIDAKCRLTKLVDQYLVERGYEEFYKPVVLRANKPGRKRNITKTSDTSKKNDNT